jgi:hypothetical protein
MDGPAVNRILLNHSSGASVEMTLASDGGLQVKETSSAGKSKVVTHPPINVGENPEAFTQPLVQLFEEKGFEVTENRLVPTWMIRAKLPVDRFGQLTTALEAAGLRPEVWPPEAITMSYPIPGTHLTMRLSGDTYRVLGEIPDRLGAPARLTSIGIARCLDANVDVVNPAGDVESMVDDWLKDNRFVPSNIMEALYVTGVFRRPLDLSRAFKSEQAASPFTLGF